MEDQGLAPPAHARIEVTSSEFRFSIFGSLGPPPATPRRLRNGIAVYG